MGLWAPWWGLSSAVVSVMARTNTAYCVQGLSGARVTPVIHAKGSVTLLLQLGGKHTCIPPLETSTDSPGAIP